MNIHLLGHPVAHSRSPQMHNAALAHLGLAGWRYSALDVLPADLPAAVHALRRPDCAGANVTVPHKEAVLAHLDALTPVAEAIGAVNTIVNRDGQLIGHNTDAAGLLADLHTHGFSVGGRVVVILGAGGSARAAVAACQSVGAQVRVVARRPQAAHGWPTLGPRQVFAWEALPQAVEGAHGFIHCTPLGMTPHSQASPWPPDLPFPPSAWVYDLVYNPPDTIFTQQARASGLRAATGLGMLLEQGALAFELWTGQPAPRQLMRQALVQG